MESPPEQRRHLNEDAEAAVADASLDVLNLDDASLGPDNLATDAYSGDVRPA